MEDDAVSLDMFHKTAADDLFQQFTTDTRPGYRSVATGEVSVTFLECWGNIGLPSFSRQLSGVKGLVKDGG